MISTHQGSLKCESGKMHESDGGSAAQASATPVANLSTTVSLDKDELIPGSDLNYFITVKNNGPDTAHAPLVSFQPPSGLANMEYSSDGGGTWSPWTGTAVVPDIPSGGSETLMVTGWVDGDPSKISNRISAASATGDPDSLDNTVSWDMAVTGTADVLGTMSVDMASAKPGDTITYTITVFNYGPMAAKAPSVTDTLSPAVENPQYSADNGASWAEWPGGITLPDLPPGANAVVLIRGTISAGAAGSIDNMAAITTPTPWLDGTDQAITAAADPVSIIRP